MLNLPLGIGQLTPSALRVRNRAKQVGAGIPDLLASSAYREVEPSDELLKEAAPMYAVLREGRSEQEDATAVSNGSNGPVKVETVDGARAAEIAEDEDREILSLDI